MQKLTVVAWLAGLAPFAGGCGQTGEDARRALTEAELEGVFTEPVVVFMTAGPEAIDAARGESSDEDFAIIADDLMWYRAQARELLGEHGIPVHEVADRRPLRFLVADTIATYAFEDQPGLDLLVAYDPGREPLPVPPVVAEEVLAFFERSPTRSVALPAGRTRPPEPRG